MGKPGKGKGKWTKIREPSVDKTKSHEDSKEIVSSAAPGTKSTSSTKKKQKQEVKDKPPTKTEMKPLTDKEPESKKRPLIEPRATVRFYRPVGYRAIYPAAWSILGLCCVRIGGAFTGAARPELIHVHPVVSALVDVTAFNVLVQKTLVESNLNRFIGNARNYPLMSGVYMSLKPLIDGMFMSNINGGLLTKFSGSMMMPDKSIVHTVVQPFLVGYAAPGTALADDPVGRFREATNLPPEDMFGHRTWQRLNLHSAVLLLILVRWVLGDTFDNMLTYVRRYFYATRAAPAAVPPTPERDPYTDLQYLLRPLRHFWSLPLSLAQTAFRNQLAAGTDMNDFETVLFSPQGINLGIFGFPKFITIIRNEQQIQEDKHGIRLVEFDRLVPTLDKSVLICHRMSSNSVSLDTNGTAYVARSRDGEDDEVVQTSMLWPVNNSPVFIAQGNRNSWIISRDDLNNTSPLQNFEALAENMNADVPASMVSIIYQFHQLDGNTIAKKANAGAYSK